MHIAKLAFAALALACGQAAFAQNGMEPVPARQSGEGDGPFGKLVIRSANVIEGSGAPPAGPVDIVIEGNRITGLFAGRAPDSATRGAAREIDARGM